MGIEKLKSSLLSEAKGDAKKILDEAEEKSKKMLEEEKSRLDSLKKQAEEEVEKNLSDQNRERMAWARLESKRILAEAKEDAIKNVVESMFEKLASVRKTPGYKKFMESAAKAGISELGAKSTIHVVKGDKALVKGGDVVEDLNGLGGLIVESQDGKLLYNMTLETLFDNRRDEIRKKISDKIFGGS